MPTTEELSANSETILSPVEVFSNLSCVFIILPTKKASASLLLRRSTTAERCHKARRHRLPVNQLPLEAEQIFDQVDGGRQAGKQEPEAHTLNQPLIPLPARRPPLGLGGRLGHGSHRYEGRLRLRFALENSLRGLPFRTSAIFLYF